MTNIPSYQERPVDGVTGQFSLPWRRWLEAVNTALNTAGSDTLSLAASIAAIATALGSPDGTVANIPDQDSLGFVIVGGDGITITGTPESGRVTVSLGARELAANLVYASPASGADDVPAFRALVNADLPVVDAVHGGTGQSAFAVGDLLYASSTTALSKLAVGSNGQVLTLASGLPSWAAAAGGGGGGQPSASTEMYRRWDFDDMGAVNSTLVGTNFLLSATQPVDYTANGGLETLVASEANAPGILRLSTGPSSASGYARLFLSAGPAYVLGGGVIRYGARIRLPTLSNGTDRFGCSVTLTNVIGGAPNLLRAFYEDDINSGQWRLDGIGAGTTSQNTSVAAVANTWQFIEVEVNAAGTSAQMIINGTPVGSPVTSNIPTVPVGLSVQINKILGTSARLLDIDFVEIRKTFTTPR